MSIMLTKVHIECDAPGCHEWWDHTMVGEPASVVRDWMRQFGWLVGRPGGRDYCPDCRVDLSARSDRDS